MQITMKDIAKIADVSQATVSRVINGNPNVNKDIAKRVQKVIDDIGFVPNKSAQTLKNNASFLIGISVVNMTNPYFMELISVLEEEARKKGYNIIIHNSNHNVLTEWENIQNFLARQADGIMLVPVADNNLSKIAKLKVPTVIITQTKQGFDSVAINHKKGVELIAEHLIYTGHNKLGFIGSKEDPKLTFFREAIFNNGLTFDENNIIALTSASNSHYQTREEISKYLDAHPILDCTAVFCFNDATSVEFIKLLNERGIKVPQDIKVIGFDDTILSKALSISSIHQPIQEMVETAFKLLLAQIQGNEKYEPVQIELNPSLIVKNSSIN